MSQHGVLTVEVRHFCGHRLTVQINWMFSPGKMYLSNGDPGYPDDWDEEWQVYNTAGRQVVQVQNCPKCNVDLDYDELFIANVKKAAEGQYDTTDEAVEEDWPEREDFERDYEEPVGDYSDWERDPDDLLPPARSR